MNESKPDLWLLRERKKRSCDKPFWRQLATKVAATRSSGRGQVPLALQKWVELRGLEPLTPTLPVWCATSCATAPSCMATVPTAPEHLLIASEHLLIAIAPQVS